jgi:hypothetical protein
MLLAVAFTAACVGEPDPPKSDAGAGSDAMDTNNPDGAVSGAGSWTDPIVIGALPFSHSGDTTMAPADLADSYSCAATTDESGGEYVYRLELATDTTVRFEVNDTPGDNVDIDVHILSGPDPAMCLSRDNVATEMALTAGTYYLTADTWVDSGGVAKAGAFRITVSAVTGNGGGGGGGGDCLTSPITCTVDDKPLDNPVPTEPAGLGGCPAGMARIEGFCIDRWEASLVAVDGSGNLSPWSPYARPDGARVRAMSAPGMVPQGYISQVEASAACAEAGKRLCTDTEWLRACQGASGSTFPYGDTREPGRCNDDRTCHPVVQYFESSASWVWSELANPCINQLPDGLATTGTYDQCVSADGIYDMMGNLHEWTADPNGTFRGGFYVDTEVNGPGCLYRTTAHNVQHWDYSTGFRCCANP